MTKYKRLSDVKGYYKKTSKFVKKEIFPDKIE